MSVDEQDGSYDDRRSAYRDRGSAVRQSDTDQYLGGVGSQYDEDLLARRSETLSVSSGSSSFSAGNLVEGRYNASIPSHR